MNTSLLLLSLILFSHLGHASPDARQRLHSDSPSYLYSLGKLIIPSEKQIDGQRQHYNEDCSATLLQTKRNKSIVLSSWHCVENYHNLGRDIIFRHLNADSQWREHVAFILKSGQSMRNDWVILQLEQPIASNNTAAVEITTLSSQSYVAAGFSGDQTVGLSGEVLTYQNDCQVSQHALNDDQITLNCWAFKGASGGAIFSAGKLVGIISQGDNEGRISYVPMHTILPAINHLL